jgi:hypothetical protein
MVAWNLLLLQLCNTKNIQHSLCLMPKDSNGDDKMTTLALVMMAFIAFQLSEMRAAGKGNALCLMHVRDKKRPMSSRKRG